MPNYRYAKDEYKRADFPATDKCLIVNDSRTFGPLSRIVLSIVYADSLNRS